MRISAAWLFKDNVGNLDMNVYTAAAVRRRLTKLSK